MNKNIKFIYCDSRGEITYREISNISKTEIYIQGYCVSDNGFRTFRKDRVLEHIDGNINHEERLEFHRDRLPAPKEKGETRSYNRRVNKFDKPEICFTGFKKEIKLNLVEMAETSGMFVRGSVTKNLVYLCCGGNAGPQKIEDSRHQGSIIINESQFSELLETGEIPEQ